MIVEEIEVEVRKHWDGEFEISRNLLQHTSLQHTSIRFESDSSPVPITINLTDEAVIRSDYDQVIEMYVQKVKLEFERREIVENCFIFEDLEDISKEEFRRIIHLTASDEEIFELMRNIDREWKEEAYEELNDRRDREAEVMRIEP